MSLAAVRAVSASTPLARNRERALASRATASLRAAEAVKGTTSNIRASRWAPDVLRLRISPAASAAASSRVTASAAQPTT